MRATVIIVCLLAIFTAACKKDNNQPKGYMFTTAFKNDLPVPVEIRRGRLWQRGPAQPDTLVYQDTLKIAAHGSYEKGQFICTENCNAPILDYTSYLTVFEIAKVVIQDKERMDSSCFTKAYISKDQFFKCDESVTGTPNIYTYSQYKETKDLRGNIIRREYIFDADDLAAVK
ncbi:hypothetical protein [Niabella sp.]|uniref:hypothetical protein n=1 Tax=Niabella sp. TaxID=1962976 RepID=UPI002629A755|nr:hypothetical protein [Niabella sp.]